MAMKIWELHGVRLRGAIRNTPDDEADVAGLVFSEKAYLLTIRDFRPEQLVKLVEDRGIEAAARTLIGHFEAGDVLNATGGRGLVLSRPLGVARLERSDEAAARHRPVAIR
jgi:hypothetical protein